ncbi:uncharacterized protein LOC132561935 [Ylistrum balloti]|uniref:uncharacterized protein LOC132561935 n=1 Tax=Ylistrum balloti TaxID=509963 RepID=UPI002905AECC|nr:uncharacterized protein LOC132561935 [Ylistrum balloti]
MAQQGEAFPDVDKSHNNYLLIYRLLECPICLEQMRKPKSLPCLHSFCEECLGTYIVTDLSGEMASATSFPCPVCRKVTSPINHAAAKKSWAEQFPANSHVQNLINLQMVPHVSKLCGPCKTTKNIEARAEVWCNVNKTFFCEPCKVNFHDVIHRDCDIVTINETSPDVCWKQLLPLTCSTHKEKMDCYCDDHQFIGCNKCIITEHRRCEVVMMIKEYCDKQKKTSQLDNMEKSLGTSSNYMELMVKAFDDQIESMQQCQDVSLSSIISLRHQINTRLDKKQEEIIKELSSTYKREKSKADLSKQKCNRLQASMQTTREAFRAAILREDNVHTIQLFHRGLTEVRACDDLICNLGRPFTSVSIKHDIDTGLHTIDDKSMGRITVERKRKELPAGIRSTKMLSKCRAKKLRKISMESNSYDSFNFDSQHGVVLLPDHHIVVSDNVEGKLMLFTEEGQYLNCIAMTNTCDMCLVGRNTVAVTSEEVIHVVNVQDSKLIYSSTINTNGRIECYGLAYMDEMFMVSTPSDIYIVTKEGEVVKFHTLRKHCYHLAYDSMSEQLYAGLSDREPGMTSNSFAEPQFYGCVVDDDVSDCVSDSIVRISMNVTMAKEVLLKANPWGGPLRFVQAHVTCPVQKSRRSNKTRYSCGSNQLTGIDVDYEGNVYVCDQQSNSVVQISVDRHKVREILTAIDGIHMPSSISVCGETFVVTNQLPRGENEMHVYQLY